GLRSMAVNADLGHCVHINFPAVPMGRASIHASGVQVAGDARAVTVQYAGNEEGCAVTVAVYQGGPEFTVSRGDSASYTEGWHGGVVRVEGFSVGGCSNLGRLRGEVSETGCQVHEGGTGLVVRILEAYVGKVGNGFDGIFIFTTGMTGNTEVTFPDIRQSFRAFAAVIRDGKGSGAANAEAVIDMAGAAGKYFTTIVAGCCPGCSREGV